MKIAGIQISTNADFARNISHAVELAEHAVEKGASVICYPELCLSPWFLKEENRSHLAYAREASDACFEPFLSLTRKTKTVIILPFFEADGGNCYNSAAVFDSGTPAGVYRKLHLPDLPLYREQFYFSAGNTNFPVFETSQGRIGVQICWDNFFPEGARILALKGAEIVIAPTAASQNTHSLWERAIIANAFANNLFVFRVNRVGQEDGVAFYGRSFCADPWGDRASELAGSKEAIVIADVDLRERDEAAKTWGFLRHRRPEEYGDLLK